VLLQEVLGFVFVRQTNFDGRTSGASLGET
jgi:hypothetical protein